ncbi:dockerin type I domain-containing protein [Desulfosarcina ovata]|uniref:dockerin type I domain-containing protein n=1 Tax=Desulfosarcina ovata TaxID=83564 RepID=UPI001563D1BB
MNEDGTINFADLSIVREYYGESGTAGWIRADVNGDGTVNYADLSLIRDHFGE